MSKPTPDQQPPAFFTNWQRSRLMPHEVESDTAAIAAAVAAAVAAELAAIEADTGEVSAAELAAIEAVEATPMPPMAAGTEAIYVVEEGDQLIFADADRSVLCTATIDRNGDKFTLDYIAPGALDEPKLVLLHAHGGVQYQTFPSERAVVEALVAHRDRARTNRGARDREEATDRAVRDAIVLGTGHYQQPDLVDDGVKLPRSEPFASGGGGDAAGGGASSSYDSGSSDSGSSDSGGGGAD